MPSLIPVPAALTPRAGFFALKDNIRIITPDDPEMIALGELLSEYIEAHTKMKLPVEHSDQVTGNILLELTADKSLGEEGYELTVTADELRRTAHCPTGLFYGLQTLRQLHSTLHAPFSRQRVQSPILPDSSGAAPCSMWRGTSSAWRMSNATLT